MQIELDKIYCGDSLEVLKQFPDNCIDMACTSPPYFQQRKYQSGEAEIGWENDVFKYADKLADVFDQVLRVLKPTGSLYLNLGNKHDTGKTGDLIPASWVVAQELVKRGWHLKSDIIYAKRNPGPASYSNRPVSSHEYVFLMTKKPNNYYYDWESIATAPAESTIKDKRPKGVMRQRVNKTSKYHEGCDEVIAGQYRKQDEMGRSDFKGLNQRYTPVDKVRRRDVWLLSVGGSKLKHFAMFNPNLLDLCVPAGCPPGGIVLDPFMGAGTTAAVALKHGRHYIGVELNSDYIPLVEERIREIQNRV